MGWNLIKDIYYYVNLICLIYFEYNSNQFECLNREWIDWRINSNCFLSPSILEKEKEISNGRYTILETLCSFIVHRLKKMWLNAQISKQQVCHNDYQTITSYNYKHRNALDKVHLLIIILSAFSLQFLCLDNLFRV